MIRPYPVPRTTHAYYFFRAFSFCVFIYFWSLCNFSVDETNENTFLTNIYIYSHKSSLIVSSRNLQGFAHFQWHKVPIIEYITQRRRVAQFRAKPQHKPWPKMAYIIAHEVSQQDKQFVLINNKECSISTTTTTQSLAL